MGGLQDLLLYVSATIREHFLGLWLVGLALAAVWARVARLPPGVPAQRVEPPRRGLRDYIAIVALAGVLAIYLFATFYRADLADHDHSALTNALLSQRSIPFPIWATEGRFWPFGLQEFNPLRHVAGSAHGYLIFSTLELLVFLATLFVLLKEFSVAARALILGLVVVTPSISLSFAGLIFPERNLLFLLALLAVAVRRLEERPTRWLLFAALALVHVALYYKEPVFILTSIFAGGRIVLAWRDSGTHGARSWRRTLESHPLEVGMLLLAVLFLAMYFGTTLATRSMGYATHLQQGETRADTLLVFLRRDPILLPFLVVLAMRVVAVVRGLARPDPLWEPLALGGLAYFAVYIELGLEADHYPAPFDLVGILYLAERARVAVSARRIRSAVPIAVAALLAVLLATSTWYLTIRRKNMAWGKAALAQFVMQVADSARGPTRVFAPGLTEYALMEFGAFLMFKGAVVAADTAAGERAGVIILEGPHRFPGGRCVPYRSVPCTHVTVPSARTLVLTFPEDEPRGGEAASLRPAGAPALTFEPVVFPVVLPWFKGIQQLLTGSEVSQRTDWMWAYAMVKK